MMLMMTMANTTWQEPCVTHTTGPSGGQSLNPAGGIVVIIIMAGSAYWNASATVAQLRVTLHHPRSVPGLRALLQPPSPGAPSVGSRPVSPAHPPPVPLSHFQRTALPNQAAGSCCRARAPAADRPHGAR